MNPMPPTPFEVNDAGVAPAPAAPSARPVTAQRPFHVMAKPIGARCNLACTYCYHLEKTALLHPTDSGALRMSDATLEVFVRDYIAAQPAGAEIIFAWQGGEPTLLGLDFSAGPWSSKNTTRPVRFACHGDCPKHRFVSTSEGQPGLSYLCPDQLGFFQHIGPAMQTMVALLCAGRAPAEIMKWAYGTS